MLAVVHALLIPVIYICSALIETEPVIQQCDECARDFRTYIPGTICNLPDGHSVFYADPQTINVLCVMSMPMPDLWTWISSQS